MHYVCLKNVEIKIHLLQALNHVKNKLHDVINYVSHVKIKKKTCIT